METLKKKYVSAHKGIDRLNSGNVRAALQLASAGLPHCQMPSRSVSAIIVTAPLFYYNLS